jgi:hypothetical protein
MIATFAYTIVLAAIYGVRKYLIIKTLRRSA